MHQLTLRVLPARLAVCTLPPDAPLPAWATQGSFHSITRTDEELSVVCDYAVVPPDVSHEGPWACLQVEGPLDFRREVDLYVHRTARIGPVSGAEPVVFDGDIAPRP